MSQYIVYNQTMLHYLLKALQEQIQSLRIDQVSGVAEEV